MDQHMMTRSVFATVASLVLLAGSGVPAAGAQTAAENATPAPLVGTTGGITEVLQLIAEGNSNKQIAEILCISIKTVQAHRLNLMAKLNLHDRADLIKYAIQRKIIDI